MRVRAAAVHLERFARTFPGGRRRALATAFTWLTGYEIHANASQNEKENREFADRGLQALAFIFDEMEDEDGESQDEDVNDLSGLCDVDTFACLLFHADRK
jgi:hypothetical protein